MHEFIAEENTCFFDICLPNYTADSLRRITYFKELGAEVSTCEVGSEAFADDTKNISTAVPDLKFLRFDATPPKLPVNFEISDLPYRGEFSTI